MKLVPLQWISFLPINKLVFQENNKLPLSKKYPTCKYKVFSPHISCNSVNFVFIAWQNLSALQLKWFVEAKNMKKDIRRIVRKKVITFKEESPNVLAKAVDKWRINPCVKPSINNIFAMFLVIKDMQKK